MNAKARGWLAAAVAVTLLIGVTVLGRGSVPAPFGDRGDPAGSMVAGRPAPPSTSETLAGARSQPGPASGRAVRDLMSQRASAVLRRDEAAFMATVDPRATPEFVAAQRALFVNLGGVPLADWSYEIDAAVTATPPSRPADDAALWAPRTTLRYALHGADTVPTSRPLGYLYVRRDGRWYVGSDDELGPDADRTWRGPWDFGPCTAVPAASGLVLGHVGQEQLLAAIAAELDGAVRAVTEVWGTDWSQQVAVVVPDSVDEMRELVGPAFAVDGIAAAAVADKVDVANHTAVGQRIVLNPVQAAKLSPGARRIVLRHEITHVAARASTADGAPMWLLEGFADYVGYRGSGLAPREAAPDLVRLMRTTGPPGALPTDADFRAGGDTGETGSLDGLDLAYQLSWSAALHVVDQAGEPGLVRLYRQIAGGPDPGQAAVDAALLDVLGTDLAGFVASWRDGLGRRFS